MTSTQNTRRGDRLDRVFTADRINSWNDAADALRFGRAGETGTDSVNRKEVPALTTSVLNKGSQVTYGTVRQLDVPAILPTDGSGDDFRLRRLIEGITPTEPGKFAISSTAIQQNTIGLMQSDGIVACKLFVPTNGNWIKWADIDTGDDSRLTAVPNGSAQIIWKDSGTNTTVDALVRLSNPEYRELAGVASGDITAGGTGNVVVYDATVNTNYTVQGVHLDWMHGGENVSDGKEVLIGWFPYEQRWRIVAAECEDSPPPAAEPTMVWHGTYTPGTGPWNPGSVLRDGEWTMVATQTPITSEEPISPFLNGNPSWSFPDAPGFATSNDPGFVQTGNQYTLNRVATIYGFRVYIPTNTADYSLSMLLWEVTDMDGTDVYRLMNQTVLSPAVGTGWTEVAFSDSRIYSIGDRLEVLLNSTNTAAETVVVDSDWLYEGSSQGGSPGAGGWNHDNQHTIVRIDEDDDAGTPQGTNLGNIIAGDVLRMFDGAGAEWRYSVVSVDGVVGGVHNFTVVRSFNNGSFLGTNTIRVARQTSTTDYSEITDHWLSNKPYWASDVKGVLRTEEGGTSTFNDNGYGADLLIDEWILPSEWDVVSRSFL